jgi:hypothetical protein
MKLSNFALNEEINDKNEVFPHLNYFLFFSRMFAFLPKFKKFSVTILFQFYPGFCFESFLYQVFTLLTTHRRFNYSMEKL